MAKAIDKMEQTRVITKIATAPCAAPILPVGKKNSEDIPICEDFSVTFNPCANVVKYPIPKIEDLHAAFRGSLI